MFHSAVFIFISALFLKNSLFYINLIDYILEPISAKMPSDFFQRVFEVVRKIPVGKVATYGQIACMLGAPQGARTVGYALNSLKTGAVFPPVPWQRVINYQGRISLPHGGGYEEQRDLLAEEGVIADDGVYDLKKYRWEGKEEY
jgi:methylated-DNA-protein-cysteine methyltransferase-like protein